MQNLISLGQRHLTALRGRLAGFGPGNAERTPSSACESRRRDQRLRKKTEAIFKVFVIMAPAM